MLDSVQSDTSLALKEPSVSHQNSDNRLIRIFVSSTFKDMMEERDELMIKTWPELRRFCRDRQVELVEVDLRWGIAEEQSTRKETLKLCLDEIKACRPFFIGLLGERYGWIPSEDAFTADLKEEQPWLIDLHGKSVTELEILYGVLNNPEMAVRSFFYLRDRRYAQSRDTNFLSENDKSNEKQLALKDQIRKICKEKSIPLRENYSDPRTLATMVLEDLKIAIEAQFPINALHDALTQEERDHEAFAEIRRRVYIGRPEYYETLDHHAENNDGPLVLLGDSGSGKSALLANWVSHWKKKHPQDILIQHYIGGTTESADHWRLMTRLMSVIKQWSNDSAELPRSHDEIKKDFPLWLSKARLKAGCDEIRIIIVLDALNQLQDQDYAHSLGWLPTHICHGALRLIASTLPGEAQSVVEKLNWKTLKVLPLTSDERKCMITTYLSWFGKKLDISHLERISVARPSENPLYLKILLDELRVTGTHEKLGERISEYLKAEEIPSLLRKVLTRYQKDYERDRKGLVSESLGLIWSARRGLTETELLHLLRPDNLPQLPLATWSPLRAVLEESLIDRAGILNFAHDFLRSAVETAFVPDLDKKDDFRLLLADYFDTQSLAVRTCDELPWLLWQTEQYERLHACLLNMDCFLEIQKRDEEELRFYWIDLSEEKNIG